MKVLVAGITGQLGAGVVEAGDDGVIELVPLLRAAASRSPAARMKRLFPDNFGPAERACEGDVTKPLWGLSAADIRRLAGDVDCVLNLAGETDWAASRSRLDAVNLDGAVHGYQLTRALQAAGGGRKLYCYASSIHAAGNLIGSVPETPFATDVVRTPYEISKWLAEQALLDAGRRPGGPAVAIVRIGGLLGSAATGVTRRRNSLYVLAERWKDLPVGVLPISRNGRLDMLARDVAGKLVTDLLAALHRKPSDDTEIVHVCAGEFAPLTRTVVETLRSLDRHGERHPPRSAFVPPASLIWASQHLDRFLRLSPRWQNALTGLRYLTFDRTFERARLAALIGYEPPAITIEEIVRLAFELPRVTTRQAPGATSLARFRA
jgi:thioester reductase-like protein